MDYLMKNLDREFWIRIKIMALKRGYSVKSLIMALLSQELKRWNKQQEG